ncbi:hypothetical protein O6H91_21G056600 [Diphasiastrum complanatum]|uniref:Uncharacterized protein n=1 Tax=Diphasiastrum complanatum TaxID=34168 RepID=A0ACC2AKS1_DIPCM|nr:hypothetical protein O6H91_21G056600 [Diphasiastrum complanatum]
MALLQATRLHALLLPPSPSRPAKELALRSSRELPLLPQPHASTRRSLSHSSASLMTRQLIIRATNADTDKVDTTIPNVTPKRSDSSSLNQLLGIKGAAKETNKWKIRLQLTKPVTWAPLIWGVVCGAAASGNFQWTLEDVAKSLTAMLVAGPLLTGYTQTINDWYDREIDAINEPYRPIPSGAISESEVFTQIWVLLISGLALAYGLDVWAGHSFPVIFSIALGGAFLSYIYSAPPLKLKQSGWIGNYALGSSYISLPWWTGQALFGSLSPDVMILTLLYSTAGLGIAIVNDFKSIEGDRAMGLQSLPVAFGVDTAKWICAGSIDITQISVAGYLIYTGKLYYGLALLGLIAPQVIFQVQFSLTSIDIHFQSSLILFTFHLRHLKFCSVLKQVVSQPLGSFCIS